MSLCLLIQTSLKLDHADQVLMAHCVLTKRKGLCLTEARIQAVMFYIQAFTSLDQC